VTGSSNDSGVLATLRECALLVRDSVAKAVDWDTPGGRAEQYHVDLVADAVAVEFLTRAGLDVLSEESGRHIAGSGVTVIVDPIDGSSNAIRGLPWFATSLCAVDRDGAIAAVVLDLTHGTLYDAQRGAGARADGVRIQASDCTRLADAYVAYSGSPHQPIGWASSRALGSIALALCYVAAGSLDGFVDFDVDVHGCWDYAGALFICQEASAHATETLGRPLLVVEHAARRSPVVAATTPLLAELALVATAKAQPKTCR
jgi:myo-inositol-1(or 4)-monophosphatase